MLYAPPAGGRATGRASRSFMRRKIDLNGDVRKGGRNTQTARAPVPAVQEEV
jgi:hypothetical protein